MGNVIVGVLLLVTGTLVVLVGLSLAVAQVITGMRGKRTPIAQQMAGLDWTGIGVVLQGLAALAKALGEWPVAALLVILGFVFDVTGIGVLAVRPI